MWGKYNVIASAFGIVYEFEGFYHDSCIYIFIETIEQIKISLYNFNLYVRKYSRKLLTKYYLLIIISEIKFLENL